MSSQRYLPSRIVSASMQENATAFWHLFHVFDEVVKIKLRVLSIIIMVLFHYQTRVLEDWNMVSPSRIRDIDLRVTELVQQLPHDTKATCTRQSLHASHSVFKDRN